MPYDIAAGNALHNNSLYLRQSVPACRGMSHAMGIVAPHDLKKQHGCKCTLLLKDSHRISSKLSVDYSYVTEYAFKILKGQGRRIFTAVFPYYMAFYTTKFPSS